MASRWQRLLHAYQRLYEQGFRRVVALDQRQRDDFFRLMVMSESLGLPNPAAWYCLELMPLMIEDFHDWHRRMGMEHSPIGGFRCC
ncbi:hypothetical protein J2T60_000243 [Natronospira proteinivora]|uniref:DNA helicase n=1 Tax=Natronospira proteinivora TaxID=1807133 RepID=A0ABT1G7I1_9GAMM|nr:cory-CC-star protein [Natronospira proteinivora]MCP1726278.1 hypothetical protein [Natronospira proteinivora]